MVDFRVDITRMDYCSWQLNGDKTRKIRQDGENRYKKGKSRMDKNINLHILVCSVRLGLDGSFCFILPTHNTRI